MRHTPSFYERHGLTLSFLALVVLTIGTLLADFLR